MTDQFVVLLTSHYPTGPGEQFLETEIHEWARPGVRLVVLPWDAVPGRVRPLPDGIEVDHTLSNLVHSRAVRLRAGVKAGLSGVLRRELADLRGRGVLNPTTARIAHSAVVQALLVEEALGRLTAARGTVDLVYTYWLKPQTCGAVLARDRGRVRRVISRSHNTDLYEEARPAHYLPLQRTVGLGIDEVHVISEHGSDYLRQRYGFGLDQVRLARLGVHLPQPEVQAPVAEDGALRLLTISTMSPMKRLDLVIDTVAGVARRRSDLTLHWTHHGEGPLRPQLEARAREVLDPLGVRWTFGGQLDHGALLEALQQPCDLMLNGSSSEGVPVSIMEAAARGIPCLATDVGATREVVDAEHGYLVPADVTADAFAERVVELLPDARSAERRAAVRRIVTERFDADRNFANFVDAVL